MTFRPELLDELLKGYENPEDLLRQGGILKQLKIDLQSPTKTGFQFNFYLWHKTIDIPSISLYLSGDFGWRSKLL